MNISEIILLKNNNGVVGRKKIKITTESDSKPSHRPNPTENRHFPCGPALMSNNKNPRLLKANISEI